MARVVGFAPFYGSDSQILILGSFPSVKSREEGFYYGNKQNRFYFTLAKTFGEPLPQTVEEKKKLLLNHKIALWDSVTSCEIVGSKDDAISHYEAAEIPALLKKIPVKKILCNGKRAWEILNENYPSLPVPVKRLSSTSPANPRYSFEEWQKELLDL